MGFTERRIKMELLTEDVEVINGNDSFRFSKNQLQEFAFYSDVWNGNMIWFDINDNEISLTTSRRNQIIQEGVSHFASILNA